MKKLMMLLLAMMAMMMAGCSKDDCEKADDVTMDAIEDACKGKDCLFCKCLKDKKVPNDQGTGCVDVEVPTVENVDEEKCEGDRLDEAKVCLADEDACTRDMVDSIEETC